MNKRFLSIGILCATLMGSLSGAVYYKLQASKYESRWAEAMTQLETALKTPKKLRTSEPLLPAMPVNRPEAVSNNNEIDTLRTRLQEQDELIAQLSSMTNRSGRTRSPRTSQDRQARMEELKKTDPKRYEEIMARREEFKQNMQKAFSQRAATLLDRDTAKMNPEELEQYENMLSLMNATWELNEKMTSPDVSSDERREIRQALQETTTELRPLLETERDQRFAELAISSGYSEAETDAFVQYIKDTIQATSLPRVRGGRTSRSRTPQSQ
jgi:uncharacterized membrane protein